MRLVGCSVSFDLGKWYTPSIFLWCHPQSNKPNAINPLVESPPPPPPPLFPPHHFCCLTVATNVLFIDHTHAFIFAWTYPCSGSHFNSAQSQRALSCPPVSFCIMAALTPSCFYFWEDFLVLYCFCCVFAVILGFVFLLYVLILMYISLVFVIRVGLDDTLKMYSVPRGEVKPIQCLFLYDNYSVPGVKSLPTLISIW